MPKAWIYARDSRREESLATQIEEMEQFAKAKDFEVAGTSSEICSAHNIDRAGLNEAIKMVKDRKADILLIDTLDRISDIPGEIREFAGLIGDLDAVTIVDKGDTMAWEEFKKVLQGGNPLQSDGEMLFTI